MSYLISKNTLLTPGLLTQQHNGMYVRTYIRTEDENQGQSGD